MRWLPGILFSLLSAGSAAAQSSVAQSSVAQSPAASEPPPAEAIVVTAVRGKARVAHPDAVQWLRALCFDPLRRTGRFAPPADGGTWTDLGEEARRQFRIADPAVAAFAMDDAGRGQQLWLKFERLEHPHGLVEDRCTLLVVGGEGHRRFVDAMSALFRGVPTQRHVGRRDGSPALAGWQQWLWTGMLRRRAKNWTALEQPRGSLPTWVVVADVPGFYGEYDYIMGDMKLRSGPGAPVTMLAFSRTTLQAR